jgi:hypothetical protein
MVKLAGGGHFRRKSLIIIINNFYVINAITNWTGEMKKLFNIIETSNHTIL